jgi:hypothetical protein
MKALPPNKFVVPADQIVDCGQVVLDGALDVPSYWPEVRVLTPVVLSPIAIVGTMRVTDELATFPMVMTEVAVSIKLILIALFPHP